jgi:MFS family permease
MLRSDSAPDGGSFFTQVCGFTMLAQLRSAWPLLFGVALLALGNGLQGTLLGIRASSEEFGAVITGVVMSAYSVGLLVGSFETPKLIARVGHIRVFAAFASTVSTAVLLYAVFVNPISWIVLRFMTGVCMSGLYIVAESWLNQASRNEDRGKLLSIYMTITFACMGLGQFLMNVSDPNGFVLFILVSALVSISLVPMSLSVSHAPEIVSSRGVGIRELYRASPLAVVACFGNGLAQGALFSMGAVYASALGFEVAKVALLMSLPLLAVVFIQYPVGMLSDRFDRRTLLTWLAFLSMALAAACTYAADISFVVLAAVFALFGAISLPLYSLAIAHANDSLDSDQLLGASSKLVLFFGIGASIGPFVAGAVMQRAGVEAFMWYFAAIYGLIGFFALYRMTQRAAVPLEEQGDFMLMTPRITPVAAAAVAEEIDASGSSEDPER